MKPYLLAVAALMLLLIGGAVLMLATQDVCGAPPTCEIWDIPCHLTSQVAQAGYMACQGVKGVLYFAFLALLVAAFAGLLIYLAVKGLKVKVGWKDLVVPALVLGSFVVLVLLVFVEIGISVIGLIPGFGDVVSIASEPALNLAELFLTFIIFLLGGSTSILALVKRTR